jgi:hypothetical protein
MNVPDIQPSNNVGAERSRQNRQQLGAVDVDQRDDRRAD